METSFLTKKVAKNYAKLLPVSLIIIFLGFGICGCSKSNEKKLAGPVQGELGIDYQIVTKYAGEGNITYVLTLKPKNFESFHAQLNKKRHNEINRRLEVYDSLMKYCEESKIKSICDSLNMVYSEVNVQKTDIICDIQFYDRKGNKLDDIRHTIIYDFNSKEAMVDRGLTVESKLNKSRIDFDNINYVEVKSSL